MSATSQFSETLLSTPDGTCPATRVAGSDHAGEAGHTIVDPASGKEVAQVGWAGPELVDEAVEVAVASWPGWAEKSARQRGEALRRIAGDLRDATDRLAQLITAESGKRLAEARAEVAFSADYFDWFAEAAATAATADQRVTPNRRFLVNRQPVGVVAALTPWNFPLSIPARKLAPALAAGCPVVLKPSELTPLAAYELVRICERHLPSGVVGFVLGDGEVVSNALVDHRDVACVTFTGSTRVGALVAARAATSFTRVTLELGGKAPFIVCEDADLERAVEILLVAKFRNNGASCIAANNVFVHQSRYTDVLDLLVDRVRSLRVGDPRDEETELGPLIQPAHVERLRNLVEQARESGCRVWSGGPVPAQGNFMEPTLVETLTDLTLWNGEIFGPVCAVRPFANEDAVVNEVNTWGCGLGGYVVSSDSERGARLAERLRIGIVGVNNGAPNTPEVPFGGFGSSGIGREGGMSGLYEFTEEQTVSVAR
ncbi:MAG TPA: aldehyde dehydrogenase family protein [Actinopolymorphaceae bacterium]|jgi:succinate-semialdehyde dehydrogenase/glutarate-semialdehyde dehydrogenase